MSHYVIRKGVKMKENDVPFNRRITRRGGSLQLTLPPEICEYLKLNDGVEILIAGQKGKFGKYLAVWRKDQKNEN